MNITDKIEIILFQQTPKVNIISDVSQYIANNSNLLNKILVFFKNQKSLIGLAANQLSINGERLLDNFFIMNYENKPIILFNPKIIETHGEITTKKEGCATWPGKYILADRYPSITIEYTTDYNIVKTHVFHHIQAQIVQHEINHLNGIPESVYSNTFKNETQKQNRNDLCSCGSNLKFKKCCMKK